MATTAAADATRTVAATLADPQYKAGRKLIDSGRLEEAANFFSGLLETRVQVLDGDEMSPALAPLYYEYGNSLLYNAEESGAVFGDAISDAEQKKRAMAIVEAQINAQAAAGAEGGATAAGASGGGEEGAAAPTPDQEAEEDLEIAWENLEMARRIYSELELTEEIRTHIAKVHLRLGDLNMVNGMYNEAADEFEKCLTHRLALPCRETRGVADAHVCRAQALFYAANTEGADKDALVRQSLEQYRSAVAIFDSMLAALKETPAADAASPGKENSGGGDGGEESSSANGNESTNGKGEGEREGKGKGKGKGATGAEEETSPAAASASSSSSSSAAVKELEDVRDQLRETIETLVSGKDMEALAEYKSGAGSTTVGFGDPSPASAFSGAGSASANGGGGSGTAVGAAGEVTTVGFGAPSGAASSGAAATTTTGFGGVSTGPGATAAATNVMVVKRKGRPAPKAATAATAAGGGGAPGAVLGAAASSPKKAKGNNK